MNFVATIGLITTDGPYGPNVMACEWTHQISYRPMLIAVHINPKSATHENIIAAKVFCVNIASAEQSAAASIAGGSSGKTTDKIKALQKLGFQFTQAQTIPVLMIEGVSFRAECKLFDYRAIGDYTMFIGEVMTSTMDKEKEPLVYSGGKYWKLGQNIQKPPEQEMQKIQQIIALCKK